MQHFFLKSLTGASAKPTSRRTMMAISASLLPAVLLFYLLLVTCKPTAVISQSSHNGGNGHRHLIDDIREAELKVARLESILKESISIVDSKNRYIKEHEKLVAEMTSEVDLLQSVLSTMKDDSTSANERFIRLEEEVRLLWATARRNNFELHTLESKAQDAAKRLEITKSKVEMMAAIVNENWIQIQHLEQALEITERRSKEVKTGLRSMRCSFLKFGTFLNDLLDLVKTTWSAVKQNHHQLQRFVKNEMQKWKYTAVLSNKEVVFFVASALITFPALSLGVILLNNFC